MNTGSPLDPATLAEGLTADYNQASTCQLEVEIAEVCAFIGSVREEVSFTGGRNVRIWAPLGGAFMLMLAGMMFRDGDSLGASVFGLAVGLVLLAGGWSHRNAGREVFMRLSRKTLWVHNLSAPVNLLDITEVAVKDDWIMTIKLGLRETADAPRHKARLAFLPSQASIQRFRGTRVVITSAGLRVDGQKLGGDDVLALIDRYIQVARAEQHLQALLERQARQRG
jgi:hypothetical protein